MPPFKQAPKHSGISLPIDMKSVHLCCTPFSVYHSRDTMHESHSKATGNLNSLPSKACSCLPQGNTPLSSPEPSRGCNTVIEEVLVALASPTLRVQFPKCEGWTTFQLNMFLDPGVVSKWIGPATEPPHGLNDSLEKSIPLREMGDKNSSSYSNMFGTFLNWLTGFGFLLNCSS